MTNSDIMLGSPEMETRRTAGVKDEQEESPPKKIKLEEEEGLLQPNDSGYVTSSEDSLINVAENSVNNDVLSSIIQQNIGEVNMLDDTLALFGEGVKNMDIVNDMFNQLGSEDVVLCNDDTLDENNDDAKEDAETSKYNPSTMTDLRKIFYGEEVSYLLSLQVTQVKAGFKSNVLEVELSDGLESTDNFYFKTSPKSPDIRAGQRLRLTSMRCIGARICVDAFEVVEEAEAGGAVEEPARIEDDFFVHLRRLRLEDKELLELMSPKSLNDYIELEEVTR